VRMVWAMAMPTLPAPTTEILVWRLVGDGGAALLMGLKKASLRSRPPGPRDEPEEVLCIVKTESFLCVGFLAQSVGVWEIFVVGVSWRERKAVVLYVRNRAFEWGERF
jgi:hypothetical protein